MSTSNSYSFSLNKYNLLARALQLINIYDPNESPESDIYSYASDALNMMLKQWEAEDIKLFKRRQGVLFTNLLQNSYQLGSVSGADRCSNSYVSTTNSSIISLAATSIVLTSIVGINVNDNIGIELDTGIRQWFVVASINTLTNTVVFTAGSTTGTAAVGKTVVTYTNKINRPLRLIRATVMDLTNNVESVMGEYSFDEYFDIPIKTSPGKPNNYYYNKVLNNCIAYTGTLYIYPSPQQVNNIILFTYADSIQDMINNNDTQDLPQEWTKGIVWNLAADLCVPHGKLTEYQIIKPEADKLKMILKDFDNDDQPLRFRIDTTGRFNL